MKEEKPFIAITKLTPKEKVKEFAKTNCDKCTHCCHFGGGFLLDEDVQRVSKFLGITKEEFENKYAEKFEKFNTKLLRLKAEKPEAVYSPCAFLDKEEKCMLHEEKPLHCVISSCNKYGDMLEQWFTLNHFVNVDDPESIRQWAVYLKTHDTIQGGSLEELVPDKKLLKKILNYEIIK
ncbi:MAG: YkgJ family cysteine cluster protein [Candidatus Woesearchaeota archaeon]|jgi:hypothetical protein|nr:YkgJ family cysteine cluster protein [Candidatus Woesearchaeota archaeon]MDP7506045.1 YkgJ family cysteine cluster protein [Candidatus Woesearchaeota archaeon]MDP7610521.1 YkgJ family cysteine cluster protein [Candidatus Woesearchaeota archaeon]|tara:strand:+ start:445 stop:978 length:534 start_codon:yes stop_codon:yes gene_type:complete